MLDFLKTCVLFYWTLLLLPLFALNYLILGILHKLWFYFISALHPELEFIRETTIRTILDTYRNQGIICVLLCIKGPAQVDSLRNHLQELVERRDKLGQLVFPRLRQSLAIRCGTYAWERNVFNLDQNLTSAPTSYKGRYITEYNIQEYVSELIGKYLPQKCSPWQVTIIQSSEDQHYVLVKLHHLLLSEGLNIGDFLPLVPSTKQRGVAFGSHSPLVNVLPKPVAIFELIQRLNEQISNWWNEFVSNYDPLLCTDLLKHTPGFFEFQATIFVALVSTVRVKSPRVVPTLKREFKTRKVTFGNLLKSVVVTFHPRNLLTAMFWPLKLQNHFIREVFALYNCLLTSYCEYNNTLVGLFYTYVPLLYRCAKEIVSYLNILVRTPKTILADLLLKNEAFQTITLCGRKSVAWSHSVQIDLIKTLSKTLGVSELEIMTGAISACIHRFLVQTKHQIPEHIPVRFRNVSSSYIFSTNVVPEDSLGGIIILNLPIRNSDRKIAVLENLVDIKNAFRSALEAQKLSHLLSLYQTKYRVLMKILPITLLGIYLKHLSKKYAISVTEVTTRSPNVYEKTTWGQEVSSVIYWRPPQANWSISLCLNEYADHVTLGVMSDSQLTPHHALLVREFPKFIQELAKTVGVLK